MVVDTVLPYELQVHFDTAEAIFQRDYPDTNYNLIPLEQQLRCTLSRRAWRMGR